MAGTDKQIAFATKIIDTIRAIEPTEIFTGPNSFVQHEWVEMNRLAISAIELAASGNMDAAEDALEAAPTSMGNAATDTVLRVIGEGYSGGAPIDAGRLIERLKPLFYAIEERRQAV